MYTTLISVEQLQALPAHNTLIVDVRHSLADFSLGRKLYAQAHIVNAHFLDIETDLSGEKTGANGRHPLPNFDVLTQKLRALGMNNDTQVVAYDDAAGCMAARVWWLLRALGHTAVAVLDGGMDAWVRAGGAVTEVVPVVDAFGNFERKASLMRVYTADEVLSQLNHGEPLLVDARSPERYRGESEPIDPIAGRIPHAHNHFCMSNVQADGHFLTPEQLHAAWEQTLPAEASKQPHNIIHYCGSGITASHNLLSMAIAGWDVSVNGAGLYAGSWSEWMMDPTRPREP